MKTTIENAQVISEQNQSVITKSGLSRPLQLVTLAVNGARGVETYGIEIWDDNIDKFSISTGDIINVHASLVGRLWGGRWSYNLVAYKVDKVVKEQEEQQ